MKKYIVLITHKHFYEDRYWAIRDSLDEARKVASSYDDEYTCEIHELGPLL
jgi:hypothetical protein